MTDHHLQDIPAWKRNLSFLVLSMILNGAGVVLLLCLMFLPAMNDPVRLLVSLFATGALGVGLSCLRIGLSDRLDLISGFLMAVGGLGFLAGMAYSTHLHSLLHAL